MSEVKEYVEELLSEMIRGEYSNLPFEEAVLRTKMLLLNLRSNNPIEKAEFFVKCIEYLEDHYKK